jgi:hypothetical protein
MGLSMIKLLAAMFVISATYVTPLQASCFEPTIPSCATNIGAFDDEFEFRQCKNEMESYQIEVEEYLACQKRHSQDVIEEYNETVESFNRRARGG